MPFVMVPGGAPIVIFVTIAQQTNLATAAGAVILTAIAYLIILPVFARCLKYFPKLVIGTILLLVSINLVKIYGGIITGQAGTPGFADPTNIMLALATIANYRDHMAVRPVPYRHVAAAFGAARSCRRRLSCRVAWCDEYGRCRHRRHRQRAGPVSVRLAGVRLRRRHSADRVQRHLDGRSNRPDRRDR
jgi:hypothetical protein